MYCVDLCRPVLLAGAQAAGAAGWSLQHVPDPRGSIDAVFGVSCPSRTLCAAVGAYLSSDSSSHTLAERWDGRRWSPQSVPDPARARHIQLFGVSCSSSSACAAVGSYENRSGTTVTLAERWTPAAARWSLQTVPDPRGAKAICSESLCCEPGVRRGRFVHDWRRQYRHARGAVGRQALGASARSRSQRRAPRKVPAGLVPLRLDVTPSAPTPPARAARLRLRA